LEKTSMRVFHERNTLTGPAVSPSHADTPCPSSSAYSFCKEVPPMIPDRILLISTDSWSGGDGFHSPAHRVRPGTRGPWQDDPPRPDPGYRRRGPRGRRDHPAHRRDGGPSRRDPRDVRGPRQGTILPDPRPPLHRHAGPRRPLDVPGSRRRPRGPRGPRDRRQRRIPPADDREPEPPAPLHAAV